MIPYINLHLHRIPNIPDEIGIFNCDLTESLPHNCSIGIHPWNTINVVYDDDFIGKNMALIRKKASDPNVIAIGEAGIDERRGADLSLQWKIFEQHVQVSEKFCKPLIIHFTGQIGELIAAKKSLRPKQRWIFHGYRKGTQQLEELYRKGIDVSFGVKYRPESLKLANELGCFWLETDANEMPIEEHYSNVAETLDMSVDELKVKLYYQAKSLLPSILQE